MEIPQEIHRRIAQSHVLSLVDLARLAAASRLFNEVYLEARIAEEAWLGQVCTVAKSAFTPDVVSFLCDWLLWKPFLPFSSQLRRSCDDVIDVDTFEFDWCRRYNGYRPSDWGELRGKKAPIRGLRQCAGSLPMWLAMHASAAGESGFCSPASSFSPEFSLMVRYRRGSDLIFRLNLCPRALLLPCLGLLHLILSDEGRHLSKEGHCHESQRATCTRCNTQQRLKLCLPPALLWRRSRSPLRCNEAVEGGGEV